MNKETRYTIIRNLTQEEFDFWKELRKLGHMNTFEKLQKVVRVAIAALLAWVSYDTYDANTAMSILSGLSVPLMLFPKWFTTIIPSTTAATKIVWNKDVRANYISKILKLKQKFQKIEDERMLNFSKELDTF